MKKLPSGLWRDTLIDHNCRVIYYDSRTRCYRVEYTDMDRLRLWVPVEDFGEDRRYESIGRWGHLLRLSTTESLPKDSRGRAPVL
jgi:hypothetical protein